MARDRGTIRTDILGDSDWRQLTAPAQWLYMVLLVHPSLSYAGVADWRPKKIAGYANGLTEDNVLEAAEELTRAAFIYIDEETEEVLIRSFVKHDGVIKHPKLKVSMANAYAGVSSARIQAYLVRELNSARDADPRAAAWSEPRVQAILKGESRSLKDDLATGAVTGRLEARKHADPSLGQGLAKAWPRLSQGLHTATATATATSPKGEGQPGTHQPGHPTPAHEQAFNRFWATYPLKQKKTAAREIFIQIITTQNINPETIIEGAQRYAQDPNRDDAFTRHPTTWLKAGCWEDTNLPPAPSTLTKADQVFSREFQRAKTINNQTPEYIPTDWSQFDTPTHTTPQRAIGENQ